MLEVRQPYLLFLGDVTDAAYAKTAFGLRDWARERCIAEWACPQATISVGLPRLSPPEAHAAGARAMIIGVANVGGRIIASWVPQLVWALESGLDLVSGMHARLESVPGLSVAAELHGRQLVDVRVPPRDIAIATGRRRAGKRLLTVGTDCALGKKYSALAIARALKSRGHDAEFRASGQTGIMIAGGGMPMDAVVGDFAAGAAELLSPDAAADHWDVIEGQGSLSHPAFAGVALALLHGSQPDVIVVCHEYGRTHVLGHPEFEVPTIEETIDLVLRLGRRTNPAVRIAGVSLNTSRLSPMKAQEVLASEGARLRLPVADPMRGGVAFERLVDACVADHGV